MISHRLRPAALAVVASAIVVAACGGSAAQSGGSPAPSSSPAIALPAGFPIGTWTTTITAADLEAVDRDALATIGMSEEALVDENSGTFTTTFGADGTWTTVQDSEKAPKWPVFRGTFKPVGTDAFDQATTFPPDFAGDVVRFTWRIEDGLLHLTVPDPPDPVLGVLMKAHPWTPAG